MGRIGCWLNGCCHGRFAVQLVEAAGLAFLAAGLALGRRRLAVPGHLWRAFLVGYALIRFGAELLRDDPAVHLGPVRAAQVVCLLGAIGFGWTLVRESPGLRPGGDR